MKKRCLMIVAFVLALTMLAGCAGTTVVINECNCPYADGEAEHPAAEATPAVKEEATEETPAEEEAEPAGDGTLKTGLAVSTKVSDSTSAAEGEDGAIKYDVTIAAVTVDGNGVIQSCKIDSVPATVNIDTTGAFTSDLEAPVQTKGELGENYGMKAYGGAVAEWDEQIAALCAYAEGKTVAELKEGAVDETGYAPDGSDLSTSATIYLGGYVGAIEAAVNNAQELGAADGDELILVTQNSVASSKPAAADAEGTAQLDAAIAVVTAKDGVITSCIIDAVQGKISFDTAGAITSDLAAPIQTKNELGEAYGMKAYGGAIAEWNEQAASFAAYVTGKTAEEVAGIAIDETTAPAEGTDLATSVTISIGGFQALIAKAFG